MTEYLVIDIMQQSFKLALILALPAMASALIIGVLVAVFQAVTSIQEQTLVFVPKMLAVMLALILFFSTMMTMAIHFTVSLYQTIPDLAK
jgi:flagellar biosynthetic protein FliQ